MRRAGFTLVELLTALVLLGIVSTAICRLLVNSRRLYRSQVQRADLNEALRLAALIVPSELRELDATDGDIVAMTPTSVTYKAMRGGGVVCLAAKAGTMSLVLDGNANFGVRGIAASDSLLVFADNADDPNSGRWLHGRVSSVGTGATCPGPTLSSAVSTTLGLTPSAGMNGVNAETLGAVGVGAPVRFFEVSRVTLYEGGDGEYWLGIQTYSSSSASWGPTQPVVGPLTSRGLSLTYYDAAGSPTSSSACVARVGIVIRARTAEAVRLSTGEMGRATDSLMTSVALRNNNRGAASC